MTTLFFKDDGLTALPLNHEINNLENFRMIIEYTDHLIVTEASLSKLLIKKITLKDFMYYVDNNLNFNKAFLYYGETAVCLKCTGRGYVDWVERAVKKTYNDDRAYNKFTRDKDYKLQRKIGKIINYYYLARTELKNGSTLCPKCEGTGLRINHE